MDAIFQTIKARFILPLNALQPLENRLVYCVFAPVYEQNTLAQNEQI